MRHEIEDTTGEKRVYYTLQGDLPMASRLVVPGDMPQVPRRPAYDTGTSIHILLTPGKAQILCVILRHQGNNGQHPRKKGYYYYQARVKNSYPQKHLWSGWEV